MKRLFIIGVIFSFVLTSIRAEVITLRTGQTVRGVIMMQNDDVVIIKDQNGSRFQYMMTDVASVSAEEKTEAQKVEEVKKVGVKKVALSLELAAGGFAVPHYGNGGSLTADLLVGSHNLADKRIFLGGGIGYHGYIGKETYSFIPLMVAVRVPLMDGRHSPQLGAAVGYGFAVSKNASHGLYAGMDAGYRYQAKKKSAVYVGLFVRFQQTKLNLTETFTDAAGQKAEYTTRNAGSNIIGYGAKFAVYF